jgi:hypothetical protein
MTDAKKDNYVWSAKKVGSVPVYGVPLETKVELAALSFADYHKHGKVAEVRMRVPGYGAVSVFDVPLTVEDLERLRTEVGDLIRSADMVLL